jgi:hypothetical protein
MKKTIIFALLLCLVTMSAQAWERSFKGEEQKEWVVEPLVWRNSMYGDVNADDLSLDFDSDTTFGSKTTFGLKLSTPIPFSKKRRWVITYNSMSNSGTVNKAVTLDGTNYNANAFMKLKMMMLDFYTTWNLSRTDKSYFDFIYGSKYQKVSLDLNGISGGAATSGSWDTPAVPFPYIGFGGAVELSKTVMFDATLKWFSLNYSSASLKTLDIDANLGVRLNPKGTETEWLAFIGYRNTYLNGSFSEDGADDHVKIGYRGPIFGVVGRF